MSRSNEEKPSGGLRLRGGLAVVGAPEIVDHEPLRLDQSTQVFGEPAPAFGQRVANRLELGVLIAYVKLELAIAFPEQAHHLFARLAGGEASESRDQRGLQIGEAGTDLADGPRCQIFGQRVGGDVVRIWFAHRWLASFTTVAPAFEHRQCLQGDTVHGSW